DRAHGGDSPTPIQGHPDELDDDNLEGEDSQDEEEQDLDILAPVAATLNEYSEQ
ncbi:unnamed protein product, partial [Pylaiella littoralis]